MGKYRRSGWFNESYRHYLASKGVRTNWRYFISPKTKRRLLELGITKEEYGARPEELRAGQRETEAGVKFRPTPTLPPSEELARMAEREFFRDSATGKRNFEAELEFQKKRNELAGLNEQIVKYADMVDPESKKTILAYEDAVASLERLEARKDDVMQAVIDAQEEGDAEKEVMAKARLERVNEQLAEADANMKRYGGAYVTINESDPSMVEAANRLRELIGERNALAEEVNEVRGVRMRPRPGLPSNREDLIVAYQVKTEKAMEAQAKLPTQGVLTLSTPVFKGPTATPLLRRGMTGEEEGRQPRAKYPTPEEIAAEAARKAEKAAVKEADKERLKEAIKAAQEVQRAREQSEKELEEAKGEPKEGEK